MERIKLHLRHPEDLPLLNSEDAMNQLRAEREQGDPLIFNYAIDARRLEAWVIGSLSQLPDPNEVRYSDQPGEYTALLLGATSNTVQQWNPERRGEFDRFLHLARIVYRRPDEAV